MRCSVPNWGARSRKINKKKKKKKKKKEKKTKRNVYMHVIFSPLSIQDSLRGPCFALLYLGIPSKYIAQCFLI